MARDLHSLRGRRRQPGHAGGCRSGVSAVQSLAEHVSGDFRVFMAPDMSQSCSSELLLLNCRRGWDATHSRASARNLAPSLACNQSAGSGRSRLRTACRHGWQPAPGQLLAVLCKPIKSAANHFLDVGHTSVVGQGCLGCEPRRRASTVSMLYTRANSAIHAARHSRKQTRLIVTAKWDEKLSSGECRMSGAGVNLECMLSPFLV